jgi:molybdate/tungstate transport system substrate-binding protein
MYLLNTYATRLIPRSRRRTAIALVGAAGVALGVAGYASSSAHAFAPRSVVATAASSGDVDVISAGSLDTLLTKTVASAFHKATGYTLVDTSGGSGTDAANIKNGISVEDVFISASPSDDTLLMGSKNGSWVNWYGSFAASPEVLGYYPKSKFAHDLKTQPWYQVITLPGFRLGRTDPSQDPGGVLAVKALKEAASEHPKYTSALRKLASESSDVYSEDPEEADIQTGQLDGAFMYEADANSQDSPFVNLTGTKFAGDYTITLLKNAPHTAAAEAFIKFLLGPTGQKEMKADHFEIVSPAKVTGSGVPSGLKSLF